MTSVSTIAALATSPTPAGIAVVRLSGEEALSITERVFSAAAKLRKTPRSMVLGLVRDPKSESTIDKCLAVSMPGPKSYTGEDTVEFHLHGSPIIARQFLRVLFQEGATSAEAGEFTKRAVLNNKLDLVQAEAVGDLIAATSERAVSIAQEQLEGRMSSALENVGEPLRDSLAELEASIDFPEEDIEPDSVARIANAIKKATTHIERLIKTYEYGQVLKDGYRVLLCGEPNVGKSSLLNRLLGTERAIVSDISGTTRDLIEEQATINGHTFLFCDSAGLTESEDTIEKIGIELALDRLGWADLVLYVVDAQRLENVQSVFQTISAKAKKVWIVVNKMDLVDLKTSEISLPDETATHFASTISSAGLDSLKDALSEEINSCRELGGDSSLIVTSERQRSLLEKSLSGLTQAHLGLTERVPPEIAAADLRSALSSLDEIVGKTYTEDILGRIFSKFCIGK